MVVAWGLAACAGRSAAPLRPAPTTQVVESAPRAAWTYEVDVAADLSLDVTATFVGPLASDLSVDEDAMRFVEDLGVFEGGKYRPIEPKAAQVRQACRTECRVHYRLRLRDAAVALSDSDVALLAGDAVFAPPSAWLLHPEPGKPTERYRFHVNTPPGIRFASAVHPVPGAPDTYEADAPTFGESTFSAFGALRMPTLPGSPAEIAIAPGVPLSDDAVAHWIGSEMTAVTRYMGRFPESRVVLFIAPGTSEAFRGKTLGGGGASVLLRTGTGANEKSLASDWVAAHELLHVASPSLSGGHAWFSEGLASYVEPIARVRLGMITPEQVWGDLIEGLPQGLPGPTDRGLEVDDSWGRVYWGGALYFLLADLGIREQTNNARSLADALRAIAATGANVETTWPIERVLTEGDRATGTQVLQDLYNRLALRPGSEDLSALSVRLGIRHDGKGVHFDDHAPLSVFRRAISENALRGEIQTPLP
jgi:hypothetical protein